MKKIVCLILTLCLSIQFSTAQKKPLEIYSVYRYYKSDKTPTGSGFKLRNFIKVSNRCLFSVYKDNITYTNKENTLYKIYGIKRYGDSIHYLVNDSSGQYFDIMINDYVIDKKHSYGVTLIKTDKNGKWLSIIRFDVNRIK